MTAVAMELLAYLVHVQTEFQQIRVQQAINAQPSSANILERVAL